MVRRSVAGLSVVDFFTRGYRISGYLDIHVHTLSDLLNDRLRSYLALADVYISRINNPGEIVATHSRAELSKDRLLFAIAPAEERFVHTGRATSYFGKQTHRAWLALPTFEIEGDFQFAGRTLDLESYLSKGPGTFLPILNGTARATMWSDLTFSGDVFLVNKISIELFCLADE
jgi:hypothetical protein